MKQIGLAVLVAAVAFLLFSVFRERSPSVKEEPNVAQPVQPTSVPTPFPAAQVRSASGLVVAADTGGGIAKATVCAVSPVGPPRCTTSANDGTFSLEDVGEATLTASAAGFAAKSQEYSGSGGAEIRLSLERGKYSLRGVVRDAEAGVLEGAIVTFRNAYSVAAVTTSADGSYQATLRPGIYEASATFEGYVSQSYQLTLAVNEQSADFELFPGSAIEGLVVTTDAQPVAGMSVIATRSSALGMGSPKAIARTNAEGAFRLDGLAQGAYSLAAVGPDAATRYEERVELAIGETVSGLELVVESAYKLEGRVVRRGTESGVAGLLVSAVNQLDEAKVESLVPTSADGRFELYGLARGRHQLLVSGRGVGGQLATSLEIDGDRSDVVLEVDAGRSITGRVVPAVEARVSLEPIKQEITLTKLLDVASTTGHATVEANVDGTFVIDRVPPGTWRVVARGPKGQFAEKSVTIADSDVDVELELEQSLSISGQVLDADGKPVTSAVVRVARADATVRTDPAASLLGKISRDNGSDGVPTDREGRFLVTGLSPGIHFVGAVDPCGYLWLANGTGSAMRVELGNAPQEIILEVEAGAQPISGKVVDASGGPVVDAVVTATLAERVFPNGSTRRIGGSAPVPPVLTDAGGNFTIENVANGKYFVSAEAPGQGTVLRMGPVATGSSDVRLQLEPLATLEGQVTGADTDGCWIVANGPVTRTTTTRAPGCKFSLRGLVPGQYDLSVVAGTLTGHRKVTLAAGDTTTTEIKISAPGSLSGVLVDKAGAPVAGVPVVAVGDNDASAKRATDMLLGLRPGASKTAPDGSFRIPNVAPGKVAVLAYAPDASLNLVGVALALVAPGQSVELGSVEFDPDADESAQ